MKIYILTFISLLYLFNLSGCQKETELKSPFNEMDERQSVQESDRDKLIRELKDPNNKKYYK